MEEVLKENKISAKIVQHTRHKISDKDMISIELEMPRIILAELNTHKILVRNSASSRAVPIKSVIEQFESGYYFEPSYWLKNQTGMQGFVEHDEKVFGMSREKAWKHVMGVSTFYAKELSNVGYHKQLAGRLLEPFLMTRVLLSGTEWDNFFNLRIHPMAEPHFRDMAIKIYLAIKDSEPTYLKPGEWHLPYIDLIRDPLSYELYYHTDTEGFLDVEDAKKISLSCVAQTSYRKHDTSLEKAEDIIGKLFGGDVCHASPAEHIATPMMYINDRQIDMIKDWEYGVTHMDRSGNFWSGQLKHFIQYRQLIPNNVCNNFTHEKFLEYTKDVIL